jgi:hypothetical protein
MSTKIKVSALHLFFSIVIESDHPVMLDKEGKIGTKFTITSDKETIKVFVTVDKKNYPIGIALLGNEDISIENADAYIVENFDEIVKAIKHEVNYIPTRGYEGASLITSEQIFSFTPGKKDESKGKGRTPGLGFKFGF